MHDLLHSQPQSLLHLLRHRLPANQSLCCHLSLFSSSPDSTFPFWMSASICANRSSWDSLFFGPLAVSRASNTSAYLWRRRDELLVLIIYTKKLLNSDWLTKECSSSVTRDQCKMCNTSANYKCFLIG